MKKSFKEGICSAIYTVACAIFVFACMSGICSISAKAATTWSIDLSNGRTIGLDFEKTNGITIDKIKEIPKDAKESMVAMLVVMAYDKDLLKNTEDVSVSSISSVLCSNPYQGLLSSLGDNSMTIRALDGSTGVGKYVLSKNTLMQSPEIDESTVYAFLELLYAITEDNIDLDRTYTESFFDDVVVNVEIKYSDAPISTNNNVNSAPSVSFEVGREIEDNGIKYRILDTAGNLSAIGLTAKAKAVNIPDSVTVAGINLNVQDVARGFMKGNKNAKTVTIGANVMSIGKEAFYKCKKLKKVNVKSTKLTSIGKKAFGKNAKGFTLKMPKSCKKAYKRLLKKAKIGSTKIK